MRGCVALAVQQSPGLWRRRLTFLGIVILASAGIQVERESTLGLVGFFRVRLDSRLRGNDEVRNGIDGVESASDVVPMGYFRAAHFTVEPESQFTFPTAFCTSDMV